MSTTVNHALKLTVSCLINWLFLERRDIMTFMLVVEHEYQNACDDDDLSRVLYP